MTGFAFTVLLKVDVYQFINVIYGLFLLLFLLINFIILYAVYKRRIGNRKKSWQQKIETIISKAIFFNEEGEDEPLNNNDERLMHNTLFRQCLIDEIIHVKKNLSGETADSLRKFYEMLSLNIDSSVKLKNAAEHIKAKGLQELAVMQQVKYVKQIFKLTNNANELVRNEAQCALVSFYGFSGLRFLNITEYPVSQWQQIQLLNKLAHTRPDNIKPLAKWMQSDNETVMVFALKLATFYNCYELYDNVALCLKKDNSLIKLNALEYLEKMPREDTPAHIITFYPSENKAYKLNVISALEEIGTEKEIPFLLKTLHDNDDDIKAAAAKTLCSLHPMGASFLQDHLFANEQPWKAIFLQLTNERAA